MEWPTPRARCHWTDAPACANAPAETTNSPGDTGIVATNPNRQKRFAQAADQKAQEELADVGRHGVLPLETQGEVLADHIALERLGCEVVDRVALHYASPPTTVGACLMTAPASSMSTTNTAVPVCS